MIHGHCPEHGARRYYGAIINGRKFCDAAGCQRMLRTEAGAELDATLRRVVSGSGGTPVVEIPAEGDGFAPAHDGAHCSCHECRLFGT